MEQATNYNIAWEKEEQNLATKSIAKIWLLAAIIIPFFAFLEIQDGMQQVLGFLYLALPLSSVLLLSVAFHKKIKLPPAVLTYSVSVIIAILFSFMASKTHIQNVHNYILGVSMITLVRGVLYFGRAKNLMVVTLINHVIAFTMIVLIRQEAITDIPNVLSAYLFSIIFIIFSYAGMQTRYNLTKENYITSLKLKDSFKEIEEKNKDILDSITYAKRLQDAILPPLSTVKKHLSESFILYKPKDIVAGDFYWLEKVGDTILIAAADCTGHGVPGAMVSVVCSNALNRTVKEFKITEPGKILDKTRELVLETFEKSESNVQDGMDISLCSINTVTKEVKWSGAYNSLVYVQDGAIHEIPADKQPIGKTDNPKPFTTHTLSLSDSSLYLFTDGYADQFGGPKGKKFKFKQLSDKLSVISNQPMEEQKRVLENTITEWKGKLEQVDDILVIGIRV
jgi:serine phosphatase RsbU (regulator of sigma subunit)